MSKSARIISAYYFSSTIRIASVFVLIAVLIAISFHMIGGLLAVLGWVFVQTTHYGFEVDTERSLYRKYFNILGLEFGTYQSYKRIKNILIEKESEYKGYICFPDDCYELVSNESKGKVEEKLDKFARDLGVRIVDESHK